MMYQELKVSVKEQQTIEFYDAKAQAWGQTHNDPAYFEPEFELYKELLERGKILELGSGTGRDAVQFLKSGYEYVGIDVSQGLLDFARTQCPTGTFLKKSLYELDFAPARFDGFWCAATLLHIPKTEIDKVLQSIKKTIKPGGIGFISLKEGNDELFEEHTGRTFFLYSQQEFSEILTRNGFVVEHELKRSIAPNSWLMFFVRC
ncbi:class I SAM-dependent methyltransferase [Candidatus Babeliales bacterium]|nr:class I SAM-dependent methyltransferase [Candidatus Babeliales bacterium]